MNIDTVNPIPQTTQTLAKAFHVAPEGLHRYRGSQRG